MPINRINHLAALVAAVVYYLFGRIWYAAFQTPWLDLIHKTTADVPSDPVPHVIAFAMGLVTAYGVALLMTNWPGGAWRGMQLGAFLGLAFVAASMLVATLYAGRGARLWLIEAGYPAIGLTIVGAIVGAWRKPAS